MKLISPKLHGVLDSLTIMCLFLLPLMFNMNGVLAATLYLLAVLQFLLMTITDYQFGVFRIIPFVLHGCVEIFVGCCLAALAVFFRYALDQQAFYYCGVLAVIYLLVPAFTRFRSTPYRPDIGSVL